jgi:hypothetical protein
MVGSEVLEQSENIYDTLRRHKNRQSLLLAIAIRPSGF